MKNLRKIALLIATSSLIVACQSHPHSESLENSSVTPTTSKTEQETSQPVSSENKVSSVSSSSVPKSSSSSSKSSSSIESSSPIEQSYSFNGQLESNSNICDNHVLNVTNRIEPTLIQRGIKHSECPNCGGFIEEYIYKLDEFSFDDTTYMYDGNERELLISGLLPYGATVQYENNKLTEIGAINATANIYGPDNELLVSKTAKLSIVENIGLPNIKITTVDGEDPDYHTQSDGSKLYKDMTVSIDNCEEKYQKTDVVGQMKVRGNSTNQSTVGKRAFRLKFNSKINMLGLNDGATEKNWVLLADFFDQSRFRNLTAFEMGNSLFNYNGLYCSDYKHVTLYMNGENRGVYLLAEQQQAKKSRIPINEAEDDYAGLDIGYLIEIDGLADQQGHIGSNGLGTTEGDPCFKSESAGKVNNVSISAKPYVIKTDTFNDEQRLFIRKYIINATKAFANTCNGNLQVVDANGEIQDSPYTTVYDTLNSFLDIDSFIRMYLLQEFLKDYDVGWGSFYLYIDFSAKSKVKRLTMSAPWDFDLGLGDKQSGGGWGGFGGWGGQSSSSDNDIPTSGISSTKDSFLNGSEYTSGMGMTTFNPWLYMLSQTDFFSEMFTKYYSCYYSSGVYQRAANQINYERVAFLDSFNANHTKYVTELPNANQAFNMQTRRYDTFDLAVDYLVKWIGERNAYLNNKYLQ